jgi:hypothetical protein
MTPTTFPVDPFRPLDGDDEARLRPLAFVRNRDGDLFPIVSDARFTYLHLPPFVQRDGRDGLPA